MVINAYADVSSRRKVDVNDLARWVLHHPNDSEQVNECLSILPPSEMEIIKVLSRAGSQKVVFLATWRLTQADIVLKRVIANTEASERILTRELRAYPLNMVHPNIIETYVLRNSNNEPFLVERKLSDVLNDKWAAKGVHEAANLLFDISKAIRFLHEKDLVHGDIKPDNIGKNGDTYVLLDFGICRERSAFTSESTPTGSLRTRAPELLLNQTPDAPEKTDVWALGATVFNAIKGRFPLIEADEPIPRISNPKERSLFEAELRKRVEKEWSDRVEFSGIADSIASILKRMLEIDPQTRISAKEVVESARDELSAFVRSESVRGEGVTRFSPMDEFTQISQFLKSTPDINRLLPPSRRKMITERLDALHKTTGFGEKEKSGITELRQCLTPYV